MDESKTKSDVEKIKKMASEGDVITEHRNFLQKEFNIYFSRLLLSAREENKCLPPNQANHVQFSTTAF